MRCYAARNCCGTADLVVRSVVANENTKCVFKTWQCFVIYANTLLQRWVVANGTKFLSAKLGHCSNRQQLYW